MNEGQNCIALWRAVLDRAYNDLNAPKIKNWKSWGKEEKNCCLSNINTFYRTVKWIKTKEFENVCDLADLNIEYTRKYFIKHVLETYNLMPKHLKQKTKGVVTWLSTQN